MTQNADYVRHEATVKWMAGYREYRPECVCGWVGSYDADNTRAQHEAAGHILEATQIDSSGTLP